MPFVGSVYVEWWLQNSIDFIEPNLSFLVRECHGSLKSENQKVLCCLRAPLFTSVLRETDRKTKVMGSPWLWQPWHQVGPRAGSIALTQLRATEVIILTGCCGNQSCQLGVFPFGLPLKGDFGNGKRGSLTPADNTAMTRERVKMIVAEETFMFACFLANCLEKDM